MGPKRRRGAEKEEESGAQDDHGVGVDSLVAVPANLNLVWQLKVLI